MQHSHRTSSPGHVWGLCSALDIVPLLRREHEVRYSYIHTLSSKVLIQPVYSTDDIVYRFGQISVGLRSYVGGMLATNAGSCSAGSGGDFIVFRGDCPESVFVHEAYVSPVHLDSSHLELTFLSIIGATP